MIFEILELQKNILEKDEVFVVIDVEEVTPTWKSPFPFPVTANIATRIPTTSLKLINFVSSKLLQVWHRRQEIVKTSWYQHSWGRTIFDVHLIIVLTKRKSNSVFTYACAYWFWFEGNNIW